MTTANSGRCACGNVGLSFAREPIIVHACYCRLCQRMSGSAVAVNIMIESAELTVEGEVELITTPSTLPAGQLIARCPNCQVALFAHHAELGREISLVNAGILDESERYPPDVHCYTSSRAAWLTISDGKPSFEGNYDTNEVWSEEAQRRISACVG